MKAAILLAGALVLAAGCSRATSIPVRSAPSTARTTTETATRSDAKHNRPARGPRKLNGVPPGHYPPSGQCRLWYEGRPPGQQPRPASCASLRGRVPAGAFVLHNGQAWDGDYDWRAAARREPGSVPQIILDVLTGRR